MMPADGAHLPRQQADSRGRDNVIVQVAGDGNSIVVGLPYLTLTRYLARRRPPKDGDPLKLLHPYALAIPLIGRDRTLADLEAWLASDAPVSARLLVASAGVGKTRLALELCDRAVAKGWDAGFATSEELTRFAAGQNLSAWGWRRPTLIVIDYAAAKLPVLHRWLKELAASSNVVGQPLRVLLLERHAEPQTGWWRELVGRSDADADAIQELFDPPEPVLLPRLVGTVDRHAVFGGMLKKLGEAQLVPPPSDAAFQARLADVSWGGEPLFLMMAALTSAQAGLGTALALSRRDVAFKVAAVEVERIKRFAGSAERTSLLTHLAAYATLCQGLTQAEALEVVEEERHALRREGAGDAATLYDLLREVLPNPDDGTAVAGVLPDMVGEGVALLALGSATPLVSVGTVLRASSRAWDRVCAAVLRTVQDFSEASSEKDVPLIWLDALVADARGDYDRLVRLLEQFPEQTVVLRERALALNAQVVEALETQKGTDRVSRLVTLAGSINNLSYRLAELGKREEALTAIEAATALYRELEVADSDTFRPSLAASLDNASLRLADLGRFEDALASSAEAVAIRRELAVMNPGAFRPALADALNNRSLRLADLGRREDALVVVLEAVALYRELEAARPEAFRSDLARALNNLSLQLTNLGRRKDALTAIREALTLYRELSAARPDAFRPDLARAFSNFSVALANLQQNDDALLAGREAVRLYRELAVAYPAMFEPALANSLNSLSNRYAELGQHEAAMPNIEEAVAIRRELAHAHPEAFLPGLAASLNNLSGRLVQVGKPEAALAAIKEGIALYRRLTAAAPERFSSELAGSLNNLSYILAGLEQPIDAQAASEEALRILKPYFLASPLAFAHWMEGMLESYESLCGATEQSPDSNLVEEIKVTLAGLEVYN